MTSNIASFLFVWRLKAQSNIMYWSKSSLDTRVWDEKILHSFPNAPDRVRYGDWPLSQSWTYLNNCTVCPRDLCCFCWCLSSLPFCAYLFVLSMFSLPTWLKRDYFQCWQMLVDNVHSGGDPNILRVQSWANHCNVIYSCISVLRYREHARRRT